MSKSPELPAFDGWDTPRFTPIPDQLFDEWLPHLSGTQVKVLLYIMRRTYGFKKNYDAISLSQITDGIVKRDGERLDWGAGVAKSSAVEAVKALVALNLITAERQKSNEYGDEATVYRLTMRSVQPVSENQTRVSYNQTPALPKIKHPRVRQSDTQETVVQDTEKQEDTSAGNELASCELRVASAKDSQNSAISDNLSGDSAGLDNLMQVNLHKPDDMQVSAPKVAQEPAEPPQSDTLSFAIVLVSEEFGDPDHAVANVSQARAVWRDVGGSEAEFLQRVKQATAVTRKQRQGACTGAQRMAKFWQALRL